MYYEADVFVQTQNRFWTTETVDISLYRVHPRELTCANGSILVFEAYLAGKVIFGRPLLMGFHDGNPGKERGEVNEVVPNCGLQ